MRVSSTWTKQKIYLADRPATTVHRCPLYVDQRFLSHFFLFSPLSSSSPPSIPRAKAPGILQIPKSDACHPVIAPQTSVCSRLLDTPATFPFHSHFSPPFLPPSPPPPLLLLAGGFRCRAKETIINSFISCFVQSPGNWPGEMFLLSIENRGIIRTRFNRQEEK